MISAARTTEVEASTESGCGVARVDTGEVVSGFLESNFEKYISDTFTAEMEDELTRPRQFVRRSGGAKRATGVVRHGRGAPGSSTAASPASAR